MATMFEKAKVVAPKETPAKKPKRMEINIAGMSKVAAIDFLIKELNALKTTEEESVKTLVKDEFIETGCKIKSRPENFRGIEGTQASASCELRSRSSASALSEEEQMLFLEHDIPMRSLSIVEECYRVNPKYSEDQTLLGKVSKAIERIKDVPDDFIELQQGSSKTVIGEDAVDVLFTKPERTVRQLLESVGIIVLKPKFAGTTQEAFTIAQPLLSRQALVQAGEAVEVQNSAPGNAPPRPRKKAA